jgi:hypothetical protein
MLLNFSPAALAKHAMSETSASSRKTFLTPTLLCPHQMYRLSPFPTPQLKSQNKNGFIRLESESLFVVGYEL